MRSLFSPAGQRALKQLPADKTLLAFDFDGTLAPLVTDPDDAFTLNFLLPVLRGLEGRGRLAVITGRGLKDIRRRLLFKPDFVVGNHGLEGLREFAHKGDQAKATCRKWVQQLHRDLAALPTDHGIYVEDKGHSLSLHYRLAKKTLRTESWLSETIDNLWPQPRVIPGKLIFNLLPKGSPHKGKALKVLMKRMKCSHAVFVGDDVTDEDAFAESGSILSIRVGRKRDSQAQYYIQDQNAMLPLMNELKGRIK